MEPIRADETALICIPVVVKNHGFEAVIDSGSKRNILSRAALDSLQLAIGPKPDLALKVVNGGLVLPDGSLIVDVYVGGKRMRDVEFIVINSFPYDVLLGKTFCEKAGLVLDFQRKQVRLDANTWQYERSTVATAHRGQIIEAQVEVMLEVNADVTDG